MITQIDTKQSRMSNMISRLNRISLITGKNVVPEWKHLSKNIHNIVELEDLCTVLERKNNIYKSTNRVKELQKEENKIDKIMLLNDDGFKEWVQNKIKTIQFIHYNENDQNNTVNDYIEQNCYMIFLNYIMKYNASVIEIKSDLTGVYSLDIELIKHHYWLKRYFIACMISASIGCCN